MRSCRARGLLAHGRGDAVRGEDDDRARGHLVGVVDEDRAALGEGLHHVHVVHDLLADVDGGPVLLQRALDGLDGPVDACAVAAGLGHQDSLGGRLCRIRSGLRGTPVGPRAALGPGRMDAHEAAAVPRADRRWSRGHRRRAGPRPSPAGRRVPRHRRQPGAAGLDAGAAEGHRAGDQGRPRPGHAAPGRGEARAGPRSTRTSRRRATARAPSPSCRSARPARTRRSRGRPADDLPPVPRPRTFPPMR